MGWERNKNWAYNITLAVLYELKIKNLKAFAPYITAGIGFLNHFHTTEGDLNFGVGGGFKYLLSDKAGLRFDCRL